MRLSVSDLEAFRYFQQDDDATLADLIAQLRKRTPPTEPMLAGIALHKALELAQPGQELRSLEANGYVFIIEPDVELELPQIRELKARKDYAIDGEVVTLTGKVDTLEGLRVDDHKSTSRFDAEKYEAGYQWRCYLDIFNADRFRWNVFEISPLGPGEKGEQLYKVWGFHQHEQHRYPGMAADVHKALHEFLDFARVHLPERFIQEAA